MLKRLAAMFAAFVIAITGALAITSPAHADTVQGCTTGSLCLYDTSVSSAPFWERDYGDAPINNCFNVAAGTSWVRNRQYREFRVFKGQFCTGTSSRIYGNTTGAMSGEWNNAIRSLYRVN